MLAALLLNLPDYYPKPAEEPNVAARGGGKLHYEKKGPRSRTAAQATRTPSDLFRLTRNTQTDLNRKENERKAALASRNFRLVRGLRPTRESIAASQTLISALGIEGLGTNPLLGAKQIQDDEALAVFMILALSE